MGVGGGILAVPAFTLLLGMTQRVAQGTSLAVILVTAPVGTIEGPSGALMSDKADFGTSRVRRWFGREWPATS